MEPQETVYCYDNKKEKCSKICCLDIVGVIILGALALVLGIIIGAAVSATILANLAALIVLAVILGILLILTIILMACNNKKHKKDKGNKCCC